jgi:hypothetical protein
MEQRSEAMTEKITVHPIAGVDFKIVPKGVALTIRYYVKEMSAAATNERQASFATQSLTVGLTATQATDIASSLQRAVQMIQSDTGPA